MKRIAVMPILLVSILAMISATSHAKEKTATSPVVGTWKCIAHGGPNGDLPFTLYIQQTATGLTGTVSAPQGDTDLTSVTFKNPHVKIAINTNQHNYSLTATLKDAKLTGKWSRDGESEGTWEGKK